MIAKFCIFVLFIVCSTSLNQSCKSTSSQSDTRGRSVLWFENARTTLDSNRLLYFFKQLEPHRSFRISPIGSANRIIHVPADVRYTISTGRIVCYIREHQDLADGATPISAYKCLEISYPQEKSHDGCIQPWFKTIYTDRFADEEVGSDWWVCIDGEKNYPREFISHPIDQCQDPQATLSPDENESCLLHALDQLEFKIPKENPEARTCQCGVDITTRLLELKSEVIQALGGLSAEDLQETCAGIASPTGWDIYNLAFTEGESLNEFGLCGKSSSYCSSTVTVNGQCYFAGEVNYYLWGLANHYCHNTFHLPQTSLASSLALVAAHRFIGKILNNSPTNIEGRALWTKAGWDALNESLEFPVYDNPDGNFPACPNKSPRLLRWTLHNISSETLP